MRDRTFRYLIPYQITRGPFWRNWLPVAGKTFNEGAEVSLICMFDPEVGQRSDRDDSGWCEE